MNIRKQILQALRKIYQQEGYSHLVLKTALEAPMLQADKALMTQVVYGTMQHYRYVRYLWQKHVERPVKEEAIQLLLDMSVYQLVFLDRIPDYAVINEAVELAKEIGHGYAPFVNGVLKQVQRSSKEVEETDPLAKLALTTSHPLWLVKMWAKHYGEEACTKICIANNENPRNCARVNTLKTTKEAILQEYACTPGKYSEDALYFEESIAQLPAFQDGRLAIQDEGSQMVALVVDPKPGDLVLDVCAAPGSKTIHMAQRMHNEGSIIAQEIYEHRSQLIEQACANYGVSIIEVKTVDSTISHTLYEPESFTHVLVDAPCSGFGVLRRKPDIKLRAKQDELDGILAVQRAILDSSAQLVKQGGTLVYSTCTLNKKENEQQVAWFCKQYPEYQVVYEQTLFPHEYDGDGFYIAKLFRLKK